MNTRIYLSLVILLGLISGVSAGDEWGVPSCWEPELIGGIGRYEFIDGLNNTYSAGGWYDVNASAAVLNNTVLTRMGALGYEQREALHWDNTTGLRGLAYLFYKGAAFEPRPYYAVFQFEHKVWGIDNLTVNITGNSTFYDNGIENVIFAVNNSNLTAAKWSRRWTTSGAARASFRVYKFGNSSDIYTLYNMTRDAAVPMSEFLNITADQEGMINLQGILALDAGSSAWRFDLSRMGNGSGVISGPHYNLYVFQPIPYWIGRFGDEDNRTDWLERNYWGCINLLGNVTFSMRLGSDVCVDTSRVMPAIPCVLDGDAVIIPSSGSTETTQNSTTPAFYDATTLGAGYSIIPYYGYNYRMDNPSIPLFFKYYDSPDALAIIPWMSGAGEVDYNDLPGSSNELLEDIGTIQLLRYNIMGSASDINISSIIFDTHLIVDGIPVECFWPVTDPFHILPAWCPEYDITWVAGLNETHFKKTFVNVSSGVMTNYSTFNNNSLANILTGTQIQHINTFKTINAQGNLSISLDVDLNVINRFALFELNFRNNLIWEGELVLADNENFYMQYNLTVLNFSYGELTGYEYGVYPYSCVVPTGYDDVYNTSSGFVTIDEPTEHVTVTVQLARELWLELYLTMQDSPLGNAICAFSTGVPNYQGSDVNGLCNLTGLNPFAEVNVTVTHESIDGGIRNAVIEISDFYNSDKQPCTEICSNFDGNYVVRWDVEKPEASFIVQTIEYGDPPWAIAGARVFWDGEYVGITDDNGWRMFPAAWEFTRHNVSASHAGYLNQTDSVWLSECSDGLKNVPYALRLVPASASAGYGLTNTVSSASGVLGMMSNKGFIGSLVVVIAIIGGAATFSLAGAATGGIGAALMMWTAGMLDISIVIIIVLVCALLMAGNAKGIIGKKGE